MRVWLTEKYDQAEKLAALLGQPRKVRGYFDTADGRVTHAIGHLLQDATPEAYRPSWRVWCFDALPMLPENTIKVPDADKEQQLRVVVSCLRAATEVVIATDAGQEGEAIARELIEHAGYRGPIRRLWTNALDPASMRKALANLRDGDSTLPLYHAAQARAKADWYVGMNLTRAYTLRARAAGAGATDGVRSVGRVQTPTLALVVRRDREIESFTARTYYELRALATAPGGETVWLRHAPKDAARLYDRPAAEALARAATHVTGPLRVESRERSAAPPKLHTLTTLQKAMSRSAGWPVAKTLETAQALYDKGLVTYPRTSGAYLPNEQEGEIPAVLRALTAVQPFARHLAAIHVNKPTLRPTVFNTAKAAEDEHHAIIPTAKPVPPDSLSSDETALYHAIGKSYLAALLPDHRFAETVMRFDAGGTVYSVTGRVPIAAGWRAVLDAEPSSEDAGDDETCSTLPAIADGARVTLGVPEIQAKRTRPALRYTEAELASDMESVAKYATDPAIRARLKENAGIGTVATRTAIIDGLKHRKYLEPQGKFIVSTAVGREHIDTLPAPLTDAATTALWEDRLDAMRKGELDAEQRLEFVNKIGDNVARLVAMLRDETDQITARRVPTEAQLALLDKVAVALGVPVPHEARATYGACSAFLNANMAAFQSRPPSAAQLAFAQKIAKERGIALPEFAVTSSVLCRKFLDEHTAAKAGAAKTKRAGGSK